MPPPIEMIDRDMARILQTKTDAEHLAIAWDMRKSAPDLLGNLLRSEHPSWSEGGVQREVVLVTGSTAAIAYGEHRFTNDIDMAVKLATDQVAAFCGAFPAEQSYLSATAAR